MSDDQLCVRPVRDDGLALWPPGQGRARAAFVARRFVNRGLLDGLVRQGEGGSSDVVAELPAQARDGGTQ
ncbi:hypothetical protein [Streptomyces flavidovirens]|uniref:Uncharacterized protein n=1 Tax=Streptomyces flavidovirens TaxID=67298 RepID=A0ABW6RNJ1_9ACTN